MKLILELTKPDDFIFLVAQTQFLQDTQHLRKSEDSFFTLILSLMRCR